MARRKRGKGIRKNLGLIIPKKAQSARDKSLILADLPPEVTKICVVDIGNNQKWRNLSEVRDSDKIVFKANGSPNVMRGRPGRKSHEQIKLEAISPEVEEINRQREVFRQKDSLVKAAETSVASPKVLQETIVRLTEIASALAFERKEAQRKGELTSIIARREVTALVAVRDASLKLADQRLKKQEIDLDSLAFKKLLVHLARTFQESMRDAGVPIEEQKNVLARLSKAVDTEEWKNRALKLMTLTASETLH
jgi:hypothetical protein